MLYPRKIEKEIYNFLDSPHIIVITGIRRSGKTSLLKRIFEKIPSQNKLFLDLENILDQKIFEENDYNNIILNLKNFGINPLERIYLFIDEIQLMPEIISPIKYLYDHYNVKFFLTGSSSFYLKNLFPDTLAGRKILFDLYPLNFQEFLLFKGVIDEYKERDLSHLEKNYIKYEKLKSFMEEYLKFGGFPQVVLTENENLKKEQLKDIFNSYFEKEVYQLADFRKINSFKNLILLLFERVGSKLDITGLSQELGITRETVYSYLSFLEKTYFAFFVSPYLKSKAREVSGRKKVYISDNGILNFFSNLQEGNLFENAVFINLKNYGKINYYQKRTGSEIDFILEESIGIEVKIKGIEKDLKKLKRIAENLKLKDYFIITKRYVENDKFIPFCFI